MGMDFRNVNPMNSKMNLISGNLLPLAINEPFSTVWRVYQAVIILLEITYVAAMIAGFTLVPLKKTLSDGVLTAIISLEAISMRVGLFARKKLIMRVIREMNDILRTADEIMENEVRSALKTIMTPFAIYGMVSVISIIVWTVQPVTLIFERSSFLYVDYNLPTAFSRSEPFSSRVLVSSSILMTFGGVYLFLKKFSVDIYMMHLVLLLTAQYRYMSVKYKMFFHAEPSSDELAGVHYRAADRRQQHAGTRFRALCRYRTVILQ